MKIGYIEKNFRESSLKLINLANKIIKEYQDKGYSLTLRQVYYQLVARDVIPNNERSYKNLGNLISDGRLAGLISWRAIEDRTRYIRKNTHWEDPSHIIQATTWSLRYDRWENQDYHVEVWVEKDALVGIIGQICEKLDINYFSCRGYVSQSEMWGAAQRLQRIGSKTPVIIHLGDHDPSGIDMSRDIVERLSLFEVEPIFERIALNMDQIEEFNPPPNPAKITDSRASTYISRYGRESWELDALKPETLEELIRNTVESYCDQGLFDEVEERENKDKEILRVVSDNWAEIEKKYGTELE
ncbi:hypothetical protein KDN24_05485 [Bacillus sp. Bva_UNVM-123]|uniref:hypothetical protein n=1 Tax=Bacillus sp. Bva_UNVM-123 TaxID=2829798 RepID=UPI00391F5580